jgi:Protein similar to CwfJ C-terminus 1/Protein similar to CwfJ C-terminus 2
VNGKFDQVFQKLVALHSKTQFSLAIIAGNLFGDSDETTNEDVEKLSKLLKGEIKLPLPTYFGLGNHAFPEKAVFKLEESAGELCPNLFFLGRKSTTKTSDGLRIVSLGGSLDSEHESTKNEFSTKYSENDAKLLRGAIHADILVTREWPEHITKGSKVDFPLEAMPRANGLISDLCTILKPKYHFSTSPKAFYEREPFFHISEEKKETFQITRFISLAQFGNADKQKWIYAFTIDPTASDPLSIPPGTTTSPLLSTSRKRAPLADQNSYRFSNDNTYTSSRPRKRRKHKQPLPGPAECFFCLSNPNVATHLITSIGNDSYVTTAKGPLTTADTFPDLDFPAHMLIIPLTHAPTLSLIPDEESRTSTRKEMNLFRTALNNMLKLKSKSLGSVTWEVSREAGIHIHWQWLPIDVKLIRKNLVDAAFRVEADNEKYPKFQSRANENDEDMEGDYFRVQTWDPANGRETALYLPLDPSFRFDMQFGRRVLAKLMELDGRKDWHDCGQILEDEEADSARFKEAFKEFDFSLED